MPHSDLCHTCYNDKYGPDCTHFDARTYYNLREFNDNRVSADEAEPGGGVGSDKETDCKEATETR